MKILCVTFNDSEVFDDSCLEIFSFIENFNKEAQITSLNFGGDKNLISKLPSHENFYVDSNLESVNPTQILDTLDNFLDNNDFDYILFQKDDLSNYVAPSISFRKNYPYLPDIKAVRVEENGNLKFIRPIHGEAAEGVYSISKSKSLVLKIRKSSFEKKALIEKSRDVKELLLSEPNSKSFKIVETNKSKPEGIQLDEADIVVSGGRGLGGKEGFDGIRELAGILNGAVGASRAAVESEWIEPGNLVGLTGKWISPTLYMTFGISGASQHLAGCSNSKNIVSVNTDPDASIFNHSRFGVVADCNEFIKEIIEELKNSN